MSENSKIEWTDHTANFWWGCVKVSDGCKNCYAETWANRWGKSIWGPASNTGREYKQSAWRDLPKWDKAAIAEGVRRKVFAQSMADFFEDHPQVTEWRRDALHLISQCTNLDFQVLTKRPENVNLMIEQATAKQADAFFADNPHVWIGTSVENQQVADERIPRLLDIPASVRFLSMEPLLGEVNVLRYIKGIDWVIAGGESGHKARPMHNGWVQYIRDQCIAADVPFLFKQWGEYLSTEQMTEKFFVGRITPTMNPIWDDTDGGWLYRVGKKKAGRLLDGVEWNQFPQIEVTHA